MQITYIKKKDLKNQDLIYDLNTDYQVMMEWEKPYMEKLIQNLKPKGRVLEVGFGLGYSANEIQKYNIESHTIIEPIMLDDLKKWKNKQTNKIEIIEGYWQNVLKNLGKFDTIFFDDAPTELFSDPENIRIYKFFYLLLNNHVNKNAKLSWYCDTNIYWLNHPETNFSIEKFKIQVPKHCNYTKGDTLFLPIIEFKNGTIKDDQHLAITNKLQLIKI